MKLPLSPPPTQGTQPTPDAGTQPNPGEATQPDSGEGSDSETDEEPPLGLQQDLSRPDEAETPGGVPVHCYSLVETINYYRITGDEVKVPTPELNDPCGADNAKWVVPSNTKEISWELHKNAGLIAKANEGFHFSGKNGKEFKKIFGNPVGSGKQCPPPASTEWIDADSGTALRLAASGLHPDTDGKAIEGYVLIATIKEDFKVVNRVWCSK